MDFPIHIDVIIKYGIVHFALLGAKTRIFFFLTIIVSLSSFLHDDIDHCKTKITKKIQTQIIYRFAFDLKFVNKNIPIRDI